MADTARSFSAVQTLLADNTTGEISAQDVRDAIESLRIHGELLVTAGATSQGSLSGTPALMTGWDTDGESTWVTPDESSDDDLTVPVDGKYLCWFNCSFTPGDDAEVYTFEIAKNGSGTGIKCRAESNATPDDLHTSMVGTVPCSASDVLTITVASGGSSSFTPLEAQFGCHLIG